MLSGIKQMLNLVKIVRDQINDLELLVELLNARITTLDEENEQLRREIKTLRQFLSGQDE